MLFRSYGYAKVPTDVRAHWEGLLSEYLQTRRADFVPIFVTLPVCALIGLASMS